jgi:hypothetical protein
MHWMFLLPKAAAPHRPDSENQSDAHAAAAHAAEVRDCAIAMAAYLPPGGGIMAGGCFVQLLDLIDGPADPPDEGDTPAAAEPAPPLATIPGETRH